MKNCIIMQNGIIKANAKVNHVVFDKEVVITEGRNLIGQRNYPLAIKKGSTI